MLVHPDVQEIPYKMWNFCKKGNVEKVDFQSFTSSLFYHKYLRFEQVTKELN